MTPHDAPSQRLIFIHGLLSSGQSYKANLLRGYFPGILTPDFEGSLEERMAQLELILSDQAGWVIIGSSFGGLMGAMFTCRHPDQVRQLILLAPALIWPEFAQSPPGPVSVPTVVYHGVRDELIPLDLVRPLAERVFTDLTFHAVDDDHSLKATAQAIDWRALVGSE
jgi:pimeloyl-ACP methyl ester carboxylesterase